MKKKLLAVFLAILTLTACKHTLDTGLAKGVEIPDLPANLEKKAEKLPPISDTSMGTAHTQGAADDMQYNVVSTQLNSLIDLYNCVKFSVNDKKDIKRCLK